MDTMSPEDRSRRMAQVRSRDTKPEMMVRRLTHSLGYRYRLHDCDLPGRPDMVFRSRRKVIFVHGCFWHRHHCSLGDRLPKSRLEFWQPKLDENRRRDARVLRALREKGWSILIIWECETAKTGMDRLAARLTQFLGKRVRRR
jgi:DNA mismatch endonuclease, patch repair protein